jgi:hypothetical protein
MDLKMDSEIFYILNYIFGKCQFLCPNKIRFLNII